MGRHTNLFEGLPGLLSLPCPTVKILPSNKPAYSPFPSSATHKHNKHYDKFEETFVCSDWVFFFMMEPFAIWVWAQQLGSGAFQCWRWIAKCNSCWILWLKCKHFSVTFRGIWVQPQTQGTTVTKLFPAALLYAVTQLNRALRALWLLFSTLCWCWMPATGSKNAALSLDSKKILPWILGNSGMVLVHVVAFLGSPVGPRSC